jgi:GNAT superfamily N-acetyltransferase
MNPNPLQFRDATLEDARPIAAHVNAAYSGPDAGLGWTPETHLHTGQRTNFMEMMHIISDPMQRIVLCFAPTLTGTVWITAQGDLGLFTVTPRRQTNGIGAALLAHAEQRAADLWACPSLTLSVISLQTALIGYYQRRGYRPTGARPFPHDEQPGALRMDFNLIQLTKSL